MFRDRSVVSLVLLAASMALAFPIAPILAADSPLVAKVVPGPENSYYTYPHCNGFWAGKFVIAQTAKTARNLFTFDPATNAIKPLASVSGARMYYAISDDGLLVISAAHKLQVLDLHRGGAPRAVYTPPSADWQVGDVPGISPDGRTANFVLHNYKVKPFLHRVMTFDVPTQTATLVVENNFSTDHSQDSPFDRTWVLYCRGDDTSASLDRLWGWNAAEAPHGRRLFDQIGSDGMPLNIGHERAMFNKPALLAVAYKDSKSRDRGLWEIGFDSSAKLVAPGENYWHCNVSSDGRWAVVDTQGPFTGAATPNAISPNTSDIVAVNLATGASVFLYRTSMAVKHPYHPHPHISPDDRWVIFNDAAQQRVIALQINPAALQHFVPKAALVSTQP